MSYKNTLAGILGDPQAWYKGNKPATRTARNAEPASLVECAELRKPRYIPIHIGSNSTSTNYNSIPLEYDPKHHPKRWWDHPDASLYEVTYHLNSSREN